MSGVLSCISGLSGPHKQKSAKKVATTEETGSLWHELPGDLCSEIGSRMETRLDVLRFRSVCNSWRFNLPSPRLFPVEVPLPPGFTRYGNSKGIRFFINERTVYSIDGKESYENSVLMMFEERRGNENDLGVGGVFSPSTLFNTGDGKIVDRRELAKVVNVEQLCITPLSTSYILQAVFLHGMRWELAKVVVISRYPNSNQFTSINPSYAATRGAELAAVVLQPNGGLSYLKFPTMEWKPIGFGTSSGFDDIADYEGSLWAIDFNGGAWVLDYNSMSMTLVVPSPLSSTDDEPKNNTIVSPYYGWYNPSSNNTGDNEKNSKHHKGRKRFVKASGKLYMVLACRIRGEKHNKIKAFQLYKQKWVEVTNIGDQAFFVVTNFSFSTSKLSFSRLRACNSGNCIFFNGMSLCRDMDEDSTGFILFPEMLQSGPSVGVYFLGFNGEEQSSFYHAIRYDDCPELNCSTFPFSLYLHKEATVLDTDPLQGYRKWVAQQAKRRRNDEGGPPSIRQSLLRLQDHSHQNL